MKRAAAFGRKNPYPHIPIIPISPLIHPHGLQCAKWEGAGPRLTANPRLA